MGYTSLTAYKYPRARYLLVAILEFHFNSLFTKPIVKQ